VLVLPQALQHQHQYRPATINPKLNQTSPPNFCGQTHSSRNTRTLLPITFSSSTWRNGQTLRSGPSIRPTSKAIVSA